MIELVASMGSVESLEIGEHCPPHLSLLLSILHSWNRSSAGKVTVTTITKDLRLLLVMEGDVSKLLPPCSVDRVSEARMVRVQLRSIGQDLVGKPVQVLDLARKPRHSLGVVLNVAGDHLEVAGLVLNNLESPFNVTNLGVNLKQEL